jgi:hypothetical protein
MVQYLSHETENIVTHSQVRVVAGGGQADNILIIFCTSGAVVHNKSSAEGKTFHMQSPVYLLIREK